MCEICRIRYFSAPRAFLDLDGNLPDNWCHKKIVSNIDVKPIQVICLDQRSYKESYEGSNIKDYFFNLEDPLEYKG